MAPEVLNSQKHNIEVDYFALGVIIFEFMMGRRPYLGRSKKEIKELIMARQVKLIRSDVPEGWSIEAADFVNKLLVRKPEDRLGFGGPHEVKNHAWLRDFNWKGLLEKKIDAPFKPTQEINFDPRALIDWREDLDYDIEFSTIQPLFKKYYFDWRESKNKINETSLNARIEDFE